MAPVVNRLTISFAGSTSSIGNWRLRLLDFHQAAKRAHVPALLVNQVGIFLERFRIASAAPHAAVC